MKPDLAARLRQTMRGETIAKNGVTGVAGVTRVAGYASKPQELRQLSRLRLENGNLGNCVSEGVFLGVSAPAESDEAEILERAGICAGSIPAPYLDAWARLNHQKPISVSEGEWRGALDDGGLFLDAWGSLAAEWDWTAGELFDVPRLSKDGGLIWRLGGALVEAFGPEHARLSDSRIIERMAIGAEVKDKA